MRFPCSKPLGLTMCILAGAVLFFCMLPMHFSRYIPAIHSIISAFITLVTCVLVFFVIYALLTKRRLSSPVPVFFLIAAGIAHGVYTVMFYSSWICIILTAAAIAVYLALYFKSKSN